MVSLGPFRMLDVGWFLFNGIMTIHIWNSWAANSRPNQTAEKVRNVNGVFHLAGVLDDGIIGGTKNIKKTSKNTNGIIG